MLMVHSNKLQLLQYKAVQALSCSCCSADDTKETPQPLQYKQYKACTCSQWQHNAKNRSHCSNGG